MSSNWERTSRQLLEIKQEVISQSKRAIKKKTPKGEQIRKDIQDNLVKLFNSFTTILASSWHTYNDTERSAARQIFISLRDKVVRAFQILHVNYKVPISCVEKINPLIIEDSGSSSSSDEDIFQNMAMSVVDFFNFAGKIIPNEFDGSPNKLQSFLDALELLNRNLNNHEENAVCFVKTRVTGKARDLITTENSLDDIIRTLRNGIKADSSQLLTTKLLNLKQNSKDAVSYSTEIESLAENLKRAYISEGVPHEIAAKYTTEKTVEALSKNINSDRAKLIIQAGTFNTVQEAITKFITNSTENTSNILHFRHNRQLNNYRQNDRQYRYRGTNTRRQTSNRNSNYHWQSNQRARGRGNNNFRFSYRGQNRPIRTYTTEQNSENQSGPQQARLGETEI